MISFARKKSFASFSLLHATELFHYLVLPKPSETNLAETFSSGVAAAAAAGIFASKFRQEQQKPCEGLLSSSATISAYFGQLI
jgi:hypothetical protein